MRRMNMFSLLARTVALAALCGAVGACDTPELQSPERGSCSERTQSNRWPQFLEEPPPIPESEVGWQVGQVAPDFALTDQFGDEVCLRQMYGHYIVLDASALWCQPCKLIGETVACTQEAYGDELVYMTFIVAGNQQGGTATDEDAVQWAKAFELDKGTLTPVVNDGEKVYTSDWPGSIKNLPLLILLDKEQRIVQTGVGLEAEDLIRRRLDRLLGTTAEQCLHGAE